VRSLGIEKIEENPRLPNQKAVDWFLENRGTFDGKPIPALREKFGLTAAQAIEVIRHA